MCVALTPDERGEANHKRVLRVINQKGPLRPHFFLGAVRGSIFDDTKGVDVIACFMHLNGHIECAPVQVKSSWAAAMHYLRKHRHRGGHRVIIIVVHRTITDEQICEIFFKKITRIWRSGAQYHNYFTQLASDRLTPHGEDILRRKIRDEVQTYGTAKKTPFAGAARWLRGLLRTR